LGGFQRADQPLRAVESASAPVRNRRRKDTSAHTARRLSFADSAADKDDRMPFTYNEDKGKASGV
jgi:hypothetical protein